MNQGDVQYLLEVQESTYTKLQSAEKVMEALNAHTAEELASVAAALERYTKLNRQMKGDLEDIFRRLRAIKHVLEQRYPQHAAAAAAAVAANAEARGRPADGDE